MSYLQPNRMIAFALMLMLMLNACGDPADKMNQNFEDSFGQLCIADYQISKGHRLPTGSSQLSVTEGQFCNWSNKGFRIQFFSNDACKDPPEFSPFSVSNVQAGKSVSQCAGLAFYDLENGGQRHYDLSPEEVRDVYAKFKKVSEYYVATFNYSRRDDTDLFYTLSAAHDVQGFPIKAVFIDDDSWTMFIDPNFSPWGDRVCEALDHYLEDRLEGKLDIHWNCQL